MDEKINAKLRLTAIKCPGDAGRSIVETALEALKLHRLVIIKSDDTDVLVMCLAATDTRGLFLKTGPNLYNIEEFQSKIEPSLIQDHLLVLHGFFCSDYTSAFFGHPTHNSLFMKLEHLARKLTVTAFRDRNANLNEVHDAGVKLILIAAMYRCDMNLNRERARMFNV